MSVITLLQFCVWSCQPMTGNERVCIRFVDMGRFMPGANFCKHMFANSIGFGVDIVADLVYIGTMTNRALCEHLHAQATWVTDPYAWCEDCWQTIDLNTGEVVSVNYAALFAR